MSESTESSPFDVFISYSSKDAVWVRGILLPGIEAAGLRAFIDFRDFRRGAASVNEMQRGVSETRKTVIVLTPDYLLSDWCELETIMLQTLSPVNRDLRLIPVLRAACTKPLKLAPFTHVDFTDGADHDLAWAQLVGCLRDDTATTRPVAPDEVVELLRNAKEFLRVGRIAEARSVLEGAIPLADQAGHRASMVKARANMAAVQLESREDAGVGIAEQLLREAHPLVPPDRPDLLHDVLHGLSECHLVAGRLAEARAVARSALQVAEVARNLSDVAATCITLASISRNEGRPDEAVKALERAEGICLSVGSLGQQARDPGDEEWARLHGLGVCYINMAGLRRDVGDIDGALAYYDKAERFHREIGEMLNAGKTLLFSGEALAAQASWNEAFTRFRDALKVFSNIHDPTWAGRSLELLARLFATHSMWDEATSAMADSAIAAVEAGDTSAQVQRLGLLAEITASAKVAAVREAASKAAFSKATRAPIPGAGETEASMLEAATDVFDEARKAVAQFERQVYSDPEIQSLIGKSLEIALAHHLHEEVAACYLQQLRWTEREEGSKDECSSPDAQAALGQALDALRRALRGVETPRRRAHILGRIANVTRRLGDRSESERCLIQAGKILESCGDDIGLANYHGSWAEIAREDGRLDDEIQSYRRVLDLVKGRVVPLLEAGTKVNLAAALRRRGDFDEALALLDSAESISKRHHIKDIEGPIAQNRTAIENRRAADEAPHLSVEELLRSLRQLTEYRPEHAVAYMGFWYFAWNLPLLSALRSGPGLTLMVVADDVASFRACVGEVRDLGDCFLMCNSEEPTVEAETRIMSIPADWLWPRDFPFFVAKKGEQDSEPWAPGDDPPKIEIAGPARMLPPYFLVDTHSEAEGEGHVMAATRPRAPAGAVDLMVRSPLSELLDGPRIWLPTDRLDADDVLVGDLRICSNRGFVPIYVGSLPSSKGVSILVRLRASLPSGGDEPARRRVLASWRSTLLRVPHLPADAAAVALHDLADLIAGYAGGAGGEGPVRELDLLLIEFRPRRGAAAKRMPAIVLAR